METMMKKSLVAPFMQLSMILALALTGAQSMSAQSANSVEGTWSVAVTVVDCTTGVVIRNVRTLQMFSHDGSFTETAFTAARGISVGKWKGTGGKTFGATFWFYRYTPAGTFASLAQGLDAITLSSDGSTFSSTGTVQDFDANGNLISTGCVTHAAVRLTTTPPNK
jgi:hypothetical protein